MTSLGVNVGVIMAVLHLVLGMHGKSAFNLTLGKKNFKSGVELINANQHQH